MAESYSDEELREMPLQKYRLCGAAEVQATYHRLQRERDKAEDAAGRLGEDLLLARRERDEARRVAKVLAQRTTASRHDWSEVMTALAYPEVSE